MTTIDIANLSPKERLDLIEELWNSLDVDDVPLTSAQEAELDRRLATLNEDIRHGRAAAAVLEDLKRRYR